MGVRTLRLEPREGARERARHDHVADVVHHASDGDERLNGAVVIGIRGAQA
ncbi:hypothetical protein [Lentzea sp. NBRC 105346]|uniref:hypothetical protein n=1 Tax=Lentzea sp. NBRC 105346 TaxID=3032205 RepID=UPI002556D4BC|nr:hypothetical protein [Lentzea sp. NBRC 105346]